MEFYRDTQGRMGYVEDGFWIFFQKESSDWDRCTEDSIGKLTKIGASDELDSSEEEEIRFLMEIKN